ncbi:MAG: hypothetical protein ACTSRO_08610 [Candidatus Heimdallarchaeaceae archaeon]
MFSKEEKYEAIKIEEKFEELIIKEDKINKAYPIQRGVGETYDHVLIIVVIIIASILLIQSQTTDFNVLLENIKEKFNFPGPDWIFITLIGIVGSTVMGILSFIATVFGPIYALFHKASLRMVRLGSYSWASFYQRLEDLFALPYIASKASFTFFDAPPIDPTTYEEFKSDMMEDLNNLKRRFTSILNLDPTSLPEKTKAVYQKFLSSKIEERLDMNKIEDFISRAFALEIWQKETSIIPGKKEPALAKFAERNNTSYREAKKALAFTTAKLRDQFISKEFFSSILLTGALKGVINVETKYNNQLEDLEYNQLAFSLALGAQRYMLDHFDKPKFSIRLKKVIKSSLVGFFVPLIELLDVFISYGKHIGSSFKENFRRGWTRAATNFVVTKFKESQLGIYNLLLKKGNEEKLEQEVSETKKSLNMLLKALLFLFKIILALPLSLYYFFKFIFQIFVGIWRFTKPEVRMKKKFENDIAIESMVSMYQEVNDKLIIGNFYYT